MDQNFNIQNIRRLVTMMPKKGREGALGVIEDGAIAVEHGRIAWIGPSAKAPKAKGAAIDARDYCVMPGLIDCHTHCVHAGSRHSEFNLRSQGKSYQEIAKVGGGIMSTVRATRAASEDELVEMALRRVNDSFARGITTMEIKTGYGLDLEAEIKLATAIGKVRDGSKCSIFGTFLGAHIVPAEFKERRADYIKLVIDEMLPEVAKVPAISAIDVFVEEGAFSPDEARQICKAGRKLGFAIHLHVDQFTDIGGGELASELGAFSADHIDRTSVAGLTAMAKEGVVGVILPGATFFTGRGHFPSARKMIDRGVKVAIASDYNPGTNPSLDLWMMATIAITQMGLTCDEALLGITANAATALGLADRGILDVGCRADMILIDAEDEHVPLYRYGANLVKVVIADGEVIGKQARGGL